MGFKNIISSMLTTLLLPNKRAYTASDGGFSNQRDSETIVAECVVCLSSLKGEEETETRVLPCMHEFHDTCIRRWLAVPHFKNTCPVCRFSMDEDCGYDDRDQFRRSQQECFTEEMVIWFSSFHVAGF